ncbi:hypothetical protein ACLB2K_041869 [Fragaria x ananassa]
METKKPYNSSSSAEIVADIEELLKQILVREPALSLIRFQCVSKHWLSLISDPEFRCRHTLRNPNPKISAFFSSKTQDDSFKSIPLETPPGWNPFKTLNNSVPDGSHLRILQSVLQWALYCNGAIHWIRYSPDTGFHWRGRIGDDASGRWMKDEDDVVHYFDICEEQLRLAPANLLVPLFVQKTSVKDFGIFPTGWPRLFHRHFGESGGCLYYIETYEHCSTRFEILEMERDYSAWLVKYYVDLNPLVAALSGQDWNAFVILGLSQEERTSQELEFDDLLLHFPGKVISYNLVNKTFKISVELADEEHFLALGHNPCIQEDAIFPYMETLVCL